MTAEDTVSDETQKPQPGFIRRNWKYALLALLFVPYFTWEAMKERKAKELNESLVVIDEKMPNLKLVFNEKNVPGEVQYGDGKRLPLDGYGMATMTWEDFQKQVDRFGEVGKSLKEADFPVVVFFNSSGFDATGDPMVVRRVKDGEVVMETNNRPKMVRFMLPVRDGGFKVFVWGSKEATVVTEEEWYRTFVGVEPPKKLPPPEELEKMTDEQLQKLGIQRMTKEEIEKKGIKVPEKVQQPADSQEKSGLRGKVFKVGGIPALQPLAVTVHVFEGKDIKPFAKIDGNSPQPKKSTKADKDGSYAIALPAGVYTVVVEHQGKLLGNAIKQDSWPSITVGNDWKSYEFRVSQ